MVYTAAQQDKQLRAQFASDVSIYKSDMLVFIDETGSDRRDTLRKKGYSLRNKPPKALNLFHSNREHVSALACMSKKGILGCELVHGGVDGDQFYDFVERSVLPNLQTFNGEAPHSVVILDNCSIHHVSSVIDLFNEVGVIVHFLPPYSPDYNPIELAFSKVKQSMKTDMHISLNIDDVVLTAFATITADDCCAWIHESGLYSD